ncbi:prenyltransferase/squalene oxidase repeat-containing protein [Saccharibacillus sacchari]|uniref:prenyltransferase/squalene oxidase repeat-containing protein n=1 Tax=Saccharibacillus sacchari TaxID=456493 RepID=UPI0004BA1626|nr:prenyltransferase/squalene oxidase repeat-containing protein [Saccharibacillus sacchari]
MPTRQAVTAEIEASIAFLENTSHFEREHDEISRGKWNGAWWHMAALYEMGEVRRIPESAIVQAKHLLRTRIWPVFVIRSSDAPAREEDMDRWDCCHCELAVFYQILAAYGCDVDTEMPWIREWLLKHQLPDGGLNCDPEAYVHSRKSSIVSTLPPLEAILRHTHRPFTEQEKAFLDEGARYLIEHRLVCSKTSGEVISAEWLKPCFPRFFEYDLLRGLSFLTEWSRKRGKPLPDGFVEEAMARVADYSDGENVRIGRQVWDPEGEWGGETFGLLEALPGIGETSEQLSRELKASVNR